jgi:hypothetical protein
MVATLHEVQHLQLVEESDLCLANPRIATKGVLGPAVWEYALRCLPKGRFVIQRPARLRKAGKRL